MTGKITKGRGCHGKVPFAVRCETLQDLDQRNIRLLCEEQPGGGRETARQRLPEGSGRTSDRKGLAHQCLLEAKLEC